MLRPSKNIASILATLALILHALLPASAGISGSGEFDVSRFICAPSGQASAEARASAERIARRLGEELPDDQNFHEPCPFCTLASVAVLPEPAAVEGPSHVFPGGTPVRVEPVLIATAHGPPLGARAPPAHA
ncbi:MAG: hypothetical protein GVY06_12420 [Alphaproteobacteria bacterium]|jgi:hypothetical protein|nr:hypothetical protein [Alphaproteobacteria bacterium]